MDNYFARYTLDGRKQLLATHHKNVAEMACEFAQPFGLGKTAYFVGGIHDDGKATYEFQEYLFNPGAKRGSVSHSATGAQNAYSVLSGSLPVSELTANVILSHHGSLRDYVTPDGKGLFSDERFRGTHKGGFTEFQFDVNSLLAELKGALGYVPDESRAFAMSMLVKLLYSCLIDADRLDAYLFDSKQTYKEYKNQETNTGDWGSLLRVLEEYISNFPLNSDMAVLRQDISSQCAVSGTREQGVYKLEVPTGGGKTLSSLRFALTHALTHGLDRIVYVIPYLSILSQTASSIREALEIGDDVLLEHHSNFLVEDSILYNPEHYKLNIGRWNKPIILTTQVQFLESIFSAKSGDLRKLHNIANSVIIFDEIQNLPVNCVHLFNEAMNFFHQVCGTTILLCTATQPLLDTAERPILFSRDASIADGGKAPKRTKIVNSLTPSGYSYSDLAEFVSRKHKNSTLVIVNTKAVAKSLFKELHFLGLPGVHLSTNMCPAHRDLEIENIRARLKKKEPIICISTQLIEAGVDISFECVIRDIAGLDSIRQAAGRCNRHGEFGEVKDVFVVNVAGENLERLPDIKIGAEIMRRLFDDGQEYDIDKYYAHYFHNRKNEMDYRIKGGGSIYDLLSTNKQGTHAHCAQGSGEKIELCSAIRSAADAFYVIAPGQVSVIVPYSDSETILNKYFKTDDILVKRKLLRQLDRYSVSLYKFQLESLQERGALSEQNGITVLAKGFYDARFGVDLDGIHEFLSI